MGYELLSGAHSVVQTPWLQTGNACVNDLTFEISVTKSSIVTSDLTATPSADNLTIEIQSDVMGIAG